MIYRIGFYMYALSLHPWYIPTKSVIWSLIIITSLVYTPMNSYNNQVPWSPSYNFVQYFTLPVVS
jgi:hypothetical protein